MYKCNECEEKFDEPVTEETTYESYYGVDGGHTPLTLYKCPYCESEDYVEIKLEEEEDE